ncbi:hypothetical protein DFH07DRAFT_784456 [Mycena maculata]|uniref:Uncharacterized protein n=1 Tax=Mycena maculata TaxID=230809 RepID=A0AAD7HGF9_9AGAR|nr:hypothetical protein DFH07DRAFT_784456 [Mycena maculata]
MAFSANSFVRRAQAETEVWHETAGTGMGGDNDAMVALRKPSQKGSKERCGNAPSGMCEKCQGHPRGYGDMSSDGDGDERGWSAEKKCPQRGPWERGWVKVSKKTRQKEERSDGIKGKVDVAELMSWNYNRRWITDDPASDIPVTSGQIGGVTEGIRPNICRGGAPTVPEGHPGLEYRLVPVLTTRFVGKLRGMGGRTGSNAHSMSGPNSFKGSSIQRCFSSEVLAKAPKFGFHGYIAGRRIWIASHMSKKVGIERAAASHVGSSRAASIGTPKR